MLIGTLCLLQGASGDISFFPEANQDTFEVHPDTPFLNSKKDLKNIWKHNGSLHFIIIRRLKLITIAMQTSQLNDDPKNSIVISIFKYAYKQLTAGNEFEQKVLWRTVRKEIS